MSAILTEAHNCWCKSLADKIGFLIDGAAYFEALADTIEQAQESIFIAAWDIDSRMKLLPGSGSNAPSHDLGHFLNDKAKRTPGLRVYILNWDFPMLYLREREWLPIFNLGWKTHRRIFYHLDDEHPIGGSQHQKFIVIDNQVAFCGGLDLTNSRWDTPHHRLDESRRKNPDGEYYGPFHDVQMIVGGKAASSLGQLFMDRWRWATGVSIAAARGRSVDLWPEYVVPALENIEVGISRTFPSYKERQEVREVESLYKEAIAAAKDAIYIENQYLTSDEIAGALKNSLSQERGPEVVIILPAKSSGWLEQSTMDALRSRILKDLEAADRHHRFQVYYPCLEDGKTSLYVHSKLIIVDDRLLSIGSANLSNRSMGLDSECNLAVEAKGDKGVRKAIIALRNCLLAEHLGSSAARISELLADQGTVIDLIETFRSGGRCLKPLAYEESLPIDGAAVAGDPQLLDPEAPIEFDRMMDRLVQFDTGRNRMQRAVTITGGVLMFLLILAVAWHWTPLSDWVGKAGLKSATAQIRSHPLFLPGAMAVYVAGGFLMIPVILPVGVTAIVLGPFCGVLYAWVGCLLSAVLNFSAGHALGKKAVRKVAGRHLNRLSRRMLKPGLLGVIMLRNAPTVPFGMVNLVAGVSGMKVKDYLLGTALGILPGIVVVSLLADRLLDFFRRPGWMNGCIVLALVSALIVGDWWMTKRLTRSGDEA